jgi:hypothetical protein
MSKPILLAGDIHGDHNWLRTELAFAARQNGCDRIIALGDFGMFWNPAALPKLRRTVAHCKSMGVDLWFLDGNHENFDLMKDFKFDPDGEKVPVYNEDLGLTYLSRGATFEWDNKTVMAFGGAFSIDKDSRQPHRSWWPDETITEGQVRYVEDSPTKVDILLSHDVPELPAKLDSFLHTGWDLPYKLEAESRTNRKMLRRVFDTVEPSAVYHGHYHHSYVDTLDQAAIVGLACNGMDRAYTIIRPTDTEKEPAS